MKRHAPDIMVTLDAAFTLDPVRVNGALQQAFRPLLPGFTFKDPDEPFTDCLAFGFRISNTFECPRNSSPRINDLKVNVIKDRPDTVGLPFPHKAGIDVDRDQVVADGAGCNSSADRTVDTPPTGP